MLDDVKQGRARCAACIRVSSCWDHLSKSKRLEGHAKKSRLSLSRLSRMIFSADLVKNCLNLYVVIGLLAFYVPGRGANFRRKEIVHTHARRAAHHLVRGMLINPGCAHPSGMDNLENSVHTEKTVGVNLNAALARIKRQLRWIDPSSRIQKFLVLIQGIAPDDLCTYRLAVRARGRKGSRVRALVPNAG